MRAVEIACDESGYEGEKLVDTTTDVFAHAGVRLGADAAAAYLDEVRRRVRSPATQYKANHLLREKNRAVLVWLLGPSSPLFRNAHVYLIDKVYFVLGRIADVLLAEPVPAGLSGDPRAQAAADRLYSEGTSHEFLIAANDLLRRGGPARRGLDREAAYRRVAAEFTAVCAPAHRPGPAHKPGPGTETGTETETEEEARRGDGRTRIERSLDTSSLSLADPLVPALVRAVGRWGGRDRVVTILHDRQITLDETSVLRLRHTLGADGPALGELRLAAAEDEPRIQLADILAGTVRKITQDRLRGRGDAELVALVRPYVDGHSIMPGFGEEGPR